MKKKKLRQTQTFVISKGNKNWRFVGPINEFVNSIDDCQFCQI